MNELDWINTIIDEGFAIVIALYLLIRFEKKIDSLENTIIQLNQSIRDYYQIDKKD